MASPAFSINGTAVSLGSVSVPAGSVVTATLLSTADVDSVEWTMVRADELTDPAVDYTLVQSGSVGQTVTFTALAALSAGALQCTVNNGVDKTTGDPSAAMTTTGKFYVPGGVTGFTEVGVAGELEDTNREASPTHGAIVWINEMVRAASVYVGPPLTANYFYQSDGTAVPVWHSYAAFGLLPPTAGSQRWSDQTTVRGMCVDGVSETNLMDWGATSVDHFTLGSNSANLDGVDIVAGAAGEFDVRVGAATNLRVSATTVSTPGNAIWSLGTNYVTHGASPAASGAIRLSTGDVIRRADGQDAQMVFTPEAQGAVGDGVTDDKAAILACVAACVAAGGGVIQFGSKPYLFSGTIDPGVTAQVTFRGMGWRCTNMAGFGDASWLAGIGTTITGTVLICSAAAADAFDVAGNNCKGLRFEDLALIGPGAGATVGINLSTTATYITQAILRNVMVANFATGVRFANSLDHSTYDLNIYGCTTGIAFGTGVTENRYYSTRIQACDTAVAMANGVAQASFIGGLVQGCKEGFAFTWASACSIKDIWFEGPAYDATAQMHFSIDSTAHPITDIAFRDCRASTACTVAPTIVEAVQRWVFDNNDFSDVTLNYETSMSRFHFTGKWDEIVQNGGTQATFDHAQQTTPNAELTTQVRHLNPVSVAFDTAAIAIDWREGDTRLYYLEHDAGGGDVDVVVGLPSSAPDFAELTLVFQQRGGLRKLTWAAGYQISWQDSWTSSGHATVKLIHVGSGTWVQVAAQAPWTYGVHAPHWTGAQFTHPTEVASTAGAPLAYDVAAADGLLLCDTSLGQTITATLPPVASMDGRGVMFYDWGGTASVDNITIAAQGGETIDGGASVAIVTDYGSAFVYCWNGEWRTIPLV